MLLLGGLTHDRRFTSTVTFPDMTRTRTTMMTMRTTTLLRRKNFWNNNSDTPSLWDDRLSHFAMLPRPQECSLTRLAEVTGISNGQPSRGSFWHPSCRVAKITFMAGLIVSPLKSHNHATWMLLLFTKNQPKTTASCNAGGCCCLPAC